MSAPCTLCGKTVYFAEKMESEGKIFHPPCHRKYVEQKTHPGTGAYGGKYNPAPTTALCPKCSQSFGDGKFCISCGASREQIQQAAGQNEVKSVPKCSSCKAELSVGTRFCGQCGAKQ